LSLCDISHKVKKELSGEALRALSGHTSRRGAVSPTIDATEATRSLQIRISPEAARMP
jgi:hypothetical protein